MNAEARRLELLSPAVKIDSLLVGSITDAGRTAADLEAAGYSGAWTAEGPHDPFLPLAVAAASTAEIELGTAIAVAFARFSMEWSRPAARMREMVRAVRAIWDAWQHGTRLRFEGEFYQHTLMTPMFTPKPSDLGDFGPPNIYLAGVGPLMTEVTGEVCDGFLCHPFTTEKYLREVTLPALTRGRAKAGASMGGYDIAGPSFVVTGDTDEEMERSSATTRQQIAFYGSTPAYRPVLEIHGWGDLQDELSTLSKRGQWVEMGSLIDDEILNTFAVVAPPEGIAPELGRRYGDIINRISFYNAYGGDPDRWQAVMAAIKAI